MLAFLPNLDPCAPRGCRQTRYLQEPFDTPPRQVHEVDSRAARADLETIVRARRQDLAAVRELGRRLECVPRMVQSINQRRGGRMDEHLVQDVAQDALLAIWERLDGFRGEGAFERWVYRFCHNAFMNHARRRARLGRLGSLEGVDAAVSGPAEIIDFDDSFAAVEQAVDDLEPPDDRIVRMRNEEGLGFDEIGRRVNLPTNTAKTRYYRALARLRSTLQSTGGLSALGGKP